MGSTLADQSSLENQSCICINRGHEEMLAIRRAKGWLPPWHGDPAQAGNCQCRCRECEATRIAWTAHLEELRHPKPTAAELEEQRHQEQLRELRREAEQHRAEVAAYWASEEGQAERKRRGEANYQYWKRAWEAEQAKYDVMCIYRPTINRSDIDGEHDYTGRGTPTEQCAAIRKAVQMRSREFGLFSYGRDLCELDFSLVPPAVKFSRPPALKELISRLITQCLTPDDDDQIRPLLWEFDEWGKQHPAELGDLFPEVFTMLTASPRWYVDAIPQRQLPPGETYVELLPGLPDQLRTLALEAGGRWRGSKAQLAELTGQSSVQALTVELARLAAELASCGIEVGPTGSRTGKSRAAEWFVEAKNDPLSLSNSQTDPDQGE